MSNSPALPVVSTTIVATIVDELASTLAPHGFPAPERAALDVLAALLEMPRSWPAMNRDATVSPDVSDRSRKAVAMLCAGAPFAYAVGTAQFRHLDLAVDERVLIPRPETEVLVDEILKTVRARLGDAESWGLAIDIGTGSGAIALSLAAEGCFDKVIATDVSDDAIDVAKSNAIKSSGALRCTVEFRHGSLLAPVRGLEATVLVSNPPYIAFSELDALPPGVRDWEPALALLSGRNGMACTEQIIADAGRSLVSGGVLALECDERRASLAAELVMASGDYCDVGVRLDLTGRERFVIASKI